MDCAHANVKCVHPYEIIRKYLCHDCGGIFLCQCELVLALRCLPHQMAIATEFGTNRRLQVAGCAKGICPECRGQPVESFPMAAIFGLKGKVERFYWREIRKTYYSLVIDQVNDLDIQMDDINHFESLYPEAAKELLRIAKQVWIYVHRTTPKYNTTETTNAEFLRRIQVPETHIEAPYMQVTKGDQRVGKWINRAGQIVDPEDVAKEWYESDGYKCLDCERSLIASLVGALLAPVIQDPSDSLLRECYRNSMKGWSKANRETPIIRIDLPEDFGQAAYFDRRRSAIAKRIDELKSCHDLLCEFDDLLPQSESLRDYLWVNSDSAVHLTRAALSAVPRNLVVACVEWAIKEFWQREPGWPDIFAFRGTEFRFIEVKSPNDELSQEQMRWFEWALCEAHIPCEICRVKKLRRHRRNA